MGNRRGREVDTGALVTTFSEPRQIQAGAAPEVENLSRLVTKYDMADPFDLRIDRVRTSTRSVMRLRQMLAEHPLAELRVIPGNRLSFCPRSRHRRAAHEIE
jgi:hypothetical protein